MNPRARTLLGALALCALAICTYGAVSASAAGLTAVECKQVPAGTGNYKSNHCTTPKVEKSNFETVVINEGEVEGTDTRTITEAEHDLGSTANPVTVFHFLVNGIEVTITCGKGNTTGGKIKNTEEAGEMKIHTTEAVAHYEECHVSPRTKPAKICTVQGTSPEAEVGKITTNKLTATTGENHQVKIKPETGETFTKFKMNASGGECFLTTAIELTVTGEAWAGRTQPHTHT